MVGITVMSIWTWAAIMIVATIVIIAAIWSAVATVIRATSVVLMLVAAV
jgi:hypothetical protein